MRVPYYTYVLEGFRVLPEVDRIRFKRLDPPDPEDAEGVALIYAGAGVERRLFVSTGDSAHIAREMLEWADCYGKVNLARADRAIPGVVPLGPTFGITAWPLPGGYVAALKIAAAGGNLERAIREVRFQAKARLPLSAYEPRASELRYVFYASRRWTGRHGAVNAARMRYLEACRTLGLDVDGGLLDDRMSLSDYLRRTQRSAVVFNSPAVHGCLGWKLGEYLALGKAIVSVPLSRELPVPLVHGTHAHFVDDDPAAIAAGVEQVVSDLAYRRHLEHNARQWYEEQLAPHRVARRLLGASA
jgi:glycosyltransferase involved in cell wall biosynthesis